MKTGAVSQTATDALPNLPAATMSAIELACLCRGQWSIENRVHDVRGVAFGDDAQQMQSGHAPHVLAAVRNTLLNLLRAAGWTNMAAALRHYSASVAAALEFIGLPSPGP